MISSEKKQVQTGSFRTAYLEHGTPGNPVLVLIHDGAFGASAENSWDRFIPLVADRFHIFAPDLLGWGGSDKVVYFDRAPYAPRVEQLRLFVSALQITDAVFMGVSFGASVLLRWAVADNSDMAARGVIAVSGTGGPYRKPDGMQALADYDPPSIQAMSDLVAWLIEDFPERDEHVERRYLASMIPGHWEAMMAPRLKNPRSDYAPPADDFLDKLAGVGLPVIFVEAIRDRLVERDWSAELVARTPGSARVLLECGHEPNIDQPALLVDVLDNAVAQWTGAGQ